MNHIIDFLQNDQQEKYIGFTWLIKLRWLAIIGQVFTILAGILFFQIAVPVFWVGLVVLAEMSSNIIFTSFLASGNDRNFQQLIFPTLIFDILLLTALLHFTGGPINPFTFLYLVHIVLGAILCPTAKSWFLTILTFLSYGLLFTPTFLSSFNNSAEIKQICELTNNNMALHLHGMWMAYTITATLINFFVTKLKFALNSHQETIANFKQQQLQSEKLHSLASLAAGAAHELSTPLATINLIAEEMTYDHEKNFNIDYLREDAKEIGQQVHICKTILSQMAADSGEMAGEDINGIMLNQLIKETLNLLGPLQERVVVESKLLNEKLLLPPIAFCRVLKGLITNGLDASGPAEQILLTCLKNDKELIFKVTDKGHGMTDIIANKCIEPFYTTKEPGKGMGLGLFLTQALVSHFKGNLAIESTTKGTVVKISFPLQIMA